MIGLRLDKGLSFIPNIGTRSRAENLITSSLVIVNGKAAKSSHRISNHDDIWISFPEPEPTHLTPLDLSLDILFEDDDLIVINKPAGLVVHPAAGHTQDTLVNALIHHTKNLSMKFGENRPGIVHRLDRDTSGVLVVAKNDFAHEHLAQQFKAKTVHRIYFAACLGVPKTQHGTIRSFLARHPTDRKRYSSIAGNVQVGKWSVTHFQVLHQNPSGLCYLKLKLETGRTHQIRVHLSESGFPVLGDVMYGADKKLKSIKSSSLRAQLEKIPRFALHAAELGFIHPTTGEQKKFSVNWPDDLKPVLLDLGFL